MSGQRGDCGCAVAGRPLVTLRVAAAHFGMSVEGLRRRIHLDGCPHVKVGQELRLDLGKVEAFYGRGTTDQAEHPEGKGAGRRGKMKGGADVSDRVHGRSVARAGA